MLFLAFGGLGQAYGSSFVPSINVGKPSPNQRILPRSWRTGIRSQGTTLKLAFCLALLLGLAAVIQAQAGDYYFYEGSKGELVISNKKPPPGSKI